MASVSDTHTLEKVYQVRDRQLSQRAVLGALVYPLVYLISVVPTGFLVRHPRICLASLLVFLVLGGIRMAICLRFDRLYPAKKELWRKTFISVIFGLGLAWGLAAAHAMVVEPWTPASLFLLFSGSGLAGGMIATIAIQKTAYRLYLLGILVPPGTMAFLSDQQFGTELGGFHVVYLLFLWVQGKRLVKGFTESTITTFTVIEQRDELQEAKKRAENASQAKSRLLANVSHELRTPMNAIVGVTEWALDQEAPDTQEEAWKEVHNAGLQLLDVINQILDFAKIDSGQLSQPKKEPFSLESSLTQVQKLFSRLAGNKGLEVILKLQAPPGLMLLGDGGRLRQIVSNLVGNAVKFTEKGSVTIDCSWSEPDHLTILVRDTGPGISEDYQDRLFEPFSQADDSSTRRYGGTGLGLAISRDLAESMKGSLKLESTTPQGSIFELRLPAPRSWTLQADAATATVEIPAYRLLVVDDDATNRGVAKRQLEQMGLRTELAADSDSAMQLCGEHRFDLILMDLQMPDADGFSVVERIRSQPESPNLTTPILAFTAHTGEEERARCLAAGMVGFINKPLRKSTIRAELERLENEQLLGAGKIGNRLSADLG